MMNRLILPALVLTAGLAGRPVLAAVNCPTQTTLSVQTDPPPLYHQQASLIHLVATATVLHADGTRSPVISGDMQFFVDGQKVATVESNGSGQAGLDLHSNDSELTVGTHTLQAAFNGRSGLPVVLGGECNSWQPSNSGGSQITIVSCPPHLLLSPGLIDFGDVQVGSSSAPRQLTASNGGGQDLIITGVSVPSGFSVAPDLTGTTLAPGASRTVNVTFAPPSVGQYQAPLKITSNADNNPQSVTLMGVGFHGPDLPNLTLSTLSHDFGSVAMGSSSQPLSVSIGNSGGAPLTITNVTVTGDFTVAPNLVGATIVQGGTRTLSVVFTPTAPGPRSGTLTVASSAPNGPQKMALTGNSVSGVQPGTWALFPQTGAALSLTVDPNRAFTLWAVSGDRATVFATAQGSLGADGKFLVPSTDNALQFSGQIAGVPSMLTLTVGRLGATLLTATAPRVADATPSLPDSLTGTFTGHGSAANGDQIDILLSIAPGGETTTSATVTRQNIPGRLAEVGMFFVDSDGSLLVPNLASDGSLTRPASSRPGTIGGGAQPVIAGSLQATAATLTLTYQFAEGGYQNTFQVPLQRH
jgi:hypothetical protein